MTPNQLPLVTLSLYLHLSHHLELFFPSSHHHLCSIRHYTTSIQSSLTWINFIIAISIRLSTRISIRLPLSRWDKSYPYPSLFLNLYWTLGQVYRLHPLLLTSQLGHPPIGQHHPHLTIYSIQFFSDTGLMVLLSHHNHVLWMVNMTIAGKKQHYAFVLLHQLLDNLPSMSTIGLLYNIACQLQQSCAKYGLLGDDILHVTFRVSVFHAFAHNWPCQLVHTVYACVSQIWPLCITIILSVCYKCF